MIKNKNKASTIDCEEAKRRFNIFIDNYLKGKARDELIHHIENCRHCFEHLQFEQMLKKKINHILKTSASEDINAKKNIENILERVFSK